LPRYGTFSPCWTNGTKGSGAARTNKSLTRFERYGIVYAMLAKQNSAEFPYEIEYKGKTIRCRTLEDMQRALESLGNSRPTRDVQPWSTDEFDKFTGRIQLQQRRLLAKLLEYGTTAWLEDFKLRELMDIPHNQALAGVLSGISKVALMFGIEPRRVYTQNTTFKHGKAHRFYQVTSEFLRAAAKHKWPSKADLKGQE
jgi:hypothetical protein